MVVLVVRRPLGLRLGQQQLLLLFLLLLALLRLQQLRTGCPNCNTSCSSSSWDLAASLPRITVVLLIVLVVVLLLLLPCPLLVLRLLQQLHLLHLPVQ